MEPEPSSIPPAPILPAEGIDLKTATILNFDPHEIARQLTIHAYRHVISKINPRDLVLEENLEVSN